MTNLRMSILAAAAIAICGPALAQTPAPAQQPQEPSIATKIENWTAKQKATIRRTWAKDKAKWDKCRGLAKDEKWTSKEYWTKQYNCMTS